MKKKKLALIYEISNNQVNSLINHLKNIRTNINIKIDDIYIYHEELSTKSIIEISDICNCIFVKKNKFRKAKFDMFKMLNGYKKIIYTTVESELSNELIDKYKGNYCVKLYNNRFVEFNFKYLLKKYNMLDFAQNCELIIITDKIEYRKIYRWCIKNTILLMPILRNRIDGILDLVVQKYNIEPTIINDSKTCIAETSKFLPKITYKSAKKINGPLVTILMPIYNRINYIDDAIGSILNQTYQNIELIIVLEYTDVQQELYKKLKKYNDKRIKIITNATKLGLSESLNIGLKQAQGKYVARMDDDDISELNRIEQQVKFLEKNKEISIVGTYMKFFGNSNLICKLPSENDELKVKCLYKTPLFHPTIMFRRDSFLENNFKYRDVYTEDYELWSRVISKLKIANIDKSLYNYRLCNDNKSLQNEKIINKSHNKVMDYQLMKYLHLKFSFDELQLLSGRIDVLGNCVNLDKLYIKKMKIWKKIEIANKKVRFYNDANIQKEICEIIQYYREIKKI